MSIQIKNENICLECFNHDCCFKDSRTKTNFYELRSETTVCPIAGLLTEGPINNNINTQSFNDKCIDCGLCVLNCHNNNLECVNIKYEIDSFADLSDLQANAIASSYLDYIFDFAANTNRNNSLNFDGYVSTKEGKEAFFEVDKSDDSLESIRRLIGDFLLYSPEDRDINIGVIVLNKIPKKGSRKVFDVVEKLKEFPTTKEYKFYFTSFRILRLFATKIKKMDFDFSDLLIDITKENIMDQYIPDIRNILNQYKK